MQAGFRMSMGADRGDVGRFHASFTEFADAHGLPSALRRSMTVVLDELLTNTITHGLSHGGVTVTAVVELDSDRLMVTLTDDGKPFDPFDQREGPRGNPDTTLSVEMRPIGGLGIHLVRKLVDEVSYARRDDRNVVVLAKRLTGGTTKTTTEGR